ncbi:phage tail length tape measure family protein [Roseomonas sp. ACRSG]|nr:phage tail length tape measure family protein [Roseomonas sp. ACRSG]
MVDLAYRASLQDGFSGPAKAVRDSANAMGKAVEDAGKVTEESSERVRRSAQTFAQMVNANDLAAKATAAHAREQDKLAAKVANVNREVAAGAATQEQANALIKDLTEASAAAHATIDRRIAMEKRQREMAADTTQAMTAQARALRDLREEYDPLYAAQQRLGTAMRDIATLEREGFVTAQQAMTIRERATRSYAQQRDEITGVAAAEREAARTAKEHAAELSRLQDRLTGYARALDPLAASLAHVEQAERDLIAARRAGITVSADQMAAVVRMRERHEEMAAASRTSGGAIKLQAHEITNLTYQLQDAAVQLAGGQNPFLILMQQGPQATGAVGGTSRAMALLRQELTPTRLAIVGATVVLGGMLLAVNAQEGALAGLRSQLRSVTTDYAKVAVEVEASAKRMAAAGLGVSRQQARDGITTLMQSAPRGLSIDFDAATRDAANLGAVLKTDVAGGFEALARTMRDPAAMVQELQERRFPGMTRELLGTVEAMVAGGQKADAFTLVMGRLRPQLTGAASDVSPLTRTIRELQSAWEGFVEKASSGLGGAGIAMLRDLRDLLSLVERAVQLAKSIPGLKQFVEIADAGPVEAGLAARRSLGLGDGAGHGATAQVPWSVPADLRPSFANAAQATGVDVELLARVFGREGVRNRDGTWRDSSVGAIGPMQVMPGTFADMAKKYGIEGTARDDSANIMAAARYLGELIQRFPNDLPRAIAAYNAGPDRQGLGSPALGGTYARRVLDGYTGPGLTIKAQQAEIAGGNSATIVLPEVKVEASSDVRLDRALAISRGELKPAEHSSRETQAAWYRDAMREIEEARGLTMDPRSLDILKNGYREVARAAEAARGPQEMLTEEMDRAIASARILDPAQRALAEAVHNYEERMRAAGEVPTDEGRNQVRAAKLKELGLAYALAGNEASRALQGQDRLAAAWGEGREAVERLTAEEKAREVVRASGIEGEEAQAQAVRELADSYQLLTTRQAENAQRAANDNARANLEVLEEERRLVGASADERERELAAYKAVQAARRSGVKDSALLEETKQLARQTADVQRETQQLSNSWNAIPSLVEDTASTIKSSIVSAIAAGEAKAISFGNIWRSIKASVFANLVELGAVNPFLNATFGGTRGTLGGIGTVLTGGGTAATTTNGVTSLSGGTDMLGSAGKLLKGSSTSSVANTGFAYLDDVLNTSLYTVGGNAAQLTSSTTSALGSMGTAANGAALYGPATPQAVQAAGGGAAANVSVMQGAASVAGLAAGAYGIYSGIQTGGGKGWAQGIGGAAGVAGGAAGLMGGAAAGGAIAAVSAVAPYVAVIAMIASYFLSGQKPSDKTGGYYVNLHSGETKSTGLEGKRYSQENRDEAQRIAEQVSGLAGTFRDLMGVSQTPFNYEVAVGNRDGITADFEGSVKRYNRDEAGATQMVQELTQAMIRSMKGLASAEVNQVINASGGDTQRTIENLEWYKGTYKGLTQQSDPTKPTPSFLRAMEDMVRPLDEAIAKARELGLSEQRLNEVRQAGIDTMIRQREDEMRSMMRADTERRDAARGQNSLVFQVLHFQEAFDAEMAAYKAALEDMDIQGQGLADMLARRTEALEAERQNITRQLVRLQQDSLHGLLDRQQAATPGGTDRLDYQLWVHDRNAQRQREDAAHDGITDLVQLERTLAAERLAIERNYAERVAAIQQGYQDRIFAATVDTSTLQGALADLDRRAVQERLQAAKQEGVDMTLLLQAQAAERLAIVKQFAEQEVEALRGLGGNIRAYVDNLRATPAGGLSPADQLSAAQEAFGKDLALARGGDQDALGRITGTADTLLSAGKGMYASGAEFQQLRDWVLSSLEALPATKSYDQMVLEALQALGGSVNVSVELTTFRVITEQLNALTDAERNKLVQTEVVLRTVEQGLGRSLTPAERAALIASEVVMREIEQAIGRNLTAAERASLAEGGTVRRDIEQILGRTLSPAEAASLVEAGKVSRLIEQVLGRDLTRAERDGLVQAAAVTRLIEQQLGRKLTAAEQASILSAGSIDRAVQQFMLRNLTDAERGSLVGSGTVTRNVIQAIETIETIQISRSIDDKLSGLLSDIRGSVARMAGKDDGVTIRLGADANTLFGDMRGYLVTIDKHLQGTYGGLPVKSASNDGVIVRANGWAHSSSKQIVKFAKGGVIGDGSILMGPTDYTLANGTRIQGGEAGPEAFLPLDRGPDGRLGLTAPMPLAPLPPMPVAGSSNLADLQAQIAALQQLMQQLLQQQQAEATRQAEADARAQQTLEAVAEEAGDMADSNRRMAANGRGVVAKRAGAR